MEKSLSGEYVSFAPLEKGASRQQTPKPKCSAGTRRVAGAGTFSTPCSCRRVYLDRKSQGLPYGVSATPCPLTFIYHMQKRKIAEWQASANS